MQKKKVFIVTDRGLYQLGYVDKIAEVLGEMGIDYKVFFDVEPDPTLEVAKKGADEMISFEPDNI